MKKKYYLFLLFLVFCVLVGSRMQGQDTIHYEDSNPRYLFMPIVIDTTVECPRCIYRTHHCPAVITCNSLQQLNSFSEYSSYVVDEPTMIYGIASTINIGQTLLLHIPDNEQFGSDLYAMLVQKEGGGFYHVDSVRYINQRQYRYFLYPQYFPNYPIHDTLVGSTEFYFTTPRVVTDTFYVGMRFSNIDCDTINHGLRTAGWPWGLLVGNLINIRNLTETNWGGYLEFGGEASWGGFFPIIVPPDTDSFECPRVQNLRVADYRDGRPMFNWDRIGGQQPFQIAFGSADEDPDSYRVAEAAAPPYLLPDFGLDSTIVYAARCRGRCHHTCVVHDTIFWSEWGDTVHFFIGRGTSEGVVPVEREETAFALTPNPTTGRVTVEMHLPQSLADMGEPLITIRDVAGHEVLHRVVPAAQAAVEIDLSHLPAGTYFVTLSTAKCTATRRLVVE